MKISITGSKGKTTILKLLENIILNFYPSKTLLTSSSTEGMWLNGDFVRELTANNYLNPLDVNNNLVNYDYFISEATSFLLAQGEYKKFNTDIAVFTGIERYEHLDVHRSFENYLNAKKILFDFLDKDSIVVLNKDDEHSDYIISNCKSKNIIKYGVFRESTYCISIESINPSEMAFCISHNNDSYKLKTRLLGEYNARNITVAFIIGKYLNIDTDFVISQISNPNLIEGRFQRFYLSNENIVIIDYAHTPSSLQNVLELSRSLYQKHKIVTVFGCGGMKCIEKRPVMGKIATELSDFVYLTSDNPRFEEKEKIISDIQSGIEKTNYKVIKERKEAIEAALLENKLSIIIIAGKGPEKKRIESKEGIDVVCPICRNNFFHKLGHKILYAYNESDLDIVYEIICKHKLSTVEYNNQIRYISNGN